MSWSSSRLREEKTLSHKREKEIKLEFFNSDFEGEIAKSIYFVPWFEREQNVIFQNFNPTQVEDGK